MNDDECLKDVFAGENFKLDGEEKDWETPLDAEMFTREIYVPDNLENLENFIRVFNEAASQTNSIKEIQLDQADFDEIRQGLANSLSDLSSGRKKANKIVVEPIFVMALKHLLKTMTER